MLAGHFHFRLRSPIIFVHKFWSTTTTSVDISPPRYSFIACTCVHMNELKTVWSDFKTLTHFSIFHKQALNINKTINIGNKTWEKKLGKSVEMGVEISPMDIDIVHRIPSCNKQPSSPTIIYKFTRRTAKGAMMQKKHVEWPE